MQTIIWYMRYVLSSSLSNYVLTFSQAVKKYFHDKGRVRTGTFELPPEVAQKSWTAEQVAGWLYGAEIKELVRKVTGLVPGKRDGFLPQFMKARRSLYNRLSRDDKRVLDGIARRWEIGGPPNYVKKRYALRPGCSCSIRELELIAL